jgi:hypothetical protein
MGMLNELEFEECWIFVYWFWEDHVVSVRDGIFIRST